MTQVESFPDKKKMCHRTGFCKSCRDLLDEKICQGRWVNITGANMNTGEPMNAYGCVDDVQYILQHSFEHRLVGIQAAVEGRGDATQAALQQLTSVTAKAAVLDQQRHDQTLSLIKPRPLTASDLGCQTQDEPQQLEFAEVMAH